MSNEELKNNMRETANWALSYVSESEGEVDAKCVAMILDSSSKLISQINEMEKVESEAKEKAALREQQAEVEAKKQELEYSRLEQEAKFNKQKTRSDDKRIWIDIAKVGAGMLTSAVMYFAYSQIFKLHGKDDFMTGTEKDAFNQIGKISKGF